MTKLIILIFATMGMLLGTGAAHATLVIDPSVDNKGTFAFSAAEGVTSITLDTGTTVDLGALSSITLDTGLGSDIEINLSVESTVEARLDDTGLPGDVFALLLDGERLIPTETSDPSELFFAEYKAILKPGRRVLSIDVVAALTPAGTGLWSVSAAVPTGETPSLSEPGILALAGGALCLLAVVGLRRRQRR